MSCIITSFVVENTPGFGPEPGKLSGQLFLNRQAHNEGTRRRKTTLLWNIKRSSQKKTLTFHIYVLECDSSVPSLGSLYNVLQVIDLFPGNTDNIVHDGWLHF